MSEHQHKLGAGQQVTAEPASSASWPRFRCHKVVSALRIGHVEGHKVWPADGDLEPIVCTPPMFARGKPVEGDYLVEYVGDGYRSFSPGSIFEAGYSPVAKMDFGDAIRALKAGKRVARAGWNGKGMWLCRVINWNGNFGGAIPEDSAWPFSPFICMKPAIGPMVPWLASQSDMLAEDWCEVELNPSREAIISPLAHSNASPVQHIST